jgi:hypothetical protein
MKSTWALVGALALAGLAPAVLPGFAAAESNAVLYEVTENLKLRPLLSGRRLATATLSGTVAAGTSVCPAGLGADYCVLTAMATDNLDVSTGQGPVTGRFRVHVQDTNPVDGAELVVLEGTLAGKIILAAAVLGGDGIPNTGDEMPVGTLTGHWSAVGVRGGPLQGLRGGGTLTGTFRLPFQLTLPTPFGCHVVNPITCTGMAPFAVYLDPSGIPLTPDPAGPRVVQVAPNEHSLGVPTVKLEITFMDRH